MGQMKKIHSHNAGQGWPTLWP